MSSSYKLIAAVLSGPPSSSKCIYTKNTATLGKKSLQPLCVLLPKHTGDHHFSWRQGTPAANTGQALPSLGNPVFDKNVKRYICSIHIGAGISVLFKIGNSKASTRKGLALGAGYSSTLLLWGK